MQSTTPTTGDLSFDDVCNIAMQMDLVDLLSFRKTSTLGRDAVDHVLHVSLTAVLELFVLDGEALRCTMRKTNSVLGGTAALKFVDRGGNWKPKVLTICVPSCGWRPLVRDLVNVHHGTVTFHGPRKLRARNGVGQLITVQCARGELRILRSISDSPLHPIARSWTTLQMNFVGADTFGIAYPDTTLAGQGITVAPFDYNVPICPTERAELEGYGYRFADHARYWTPRDLRGICQRWTCFAQPRYFGDGGSLVAAVVTCDDDVYSRVLPSGLGVLWRLGGEGCGGTCSRVTIPFVRNMMLW